MIKDVTVDIIAFVTISGGAMPVTVEEGVRVVDATRTRNFTMKVTVRPSAFNHDDEEIMRLEVIYLAQAAALRLVRKEVEAIRTATEHFISWEHEFHITNIEFNNTTE